MAGARSVALKDLRAQAAVLEPAVLRSGAISAEEMAQSKPGKALNPQTGAWGWLRYLIILQRAHAVSVQEGAKQSTPAREEADAVGNGDGHCVESRFQVIPRCS